jgi:serine/threonine protein kinase
MTRLLKNRYRLVSQIGSGGYGKVYKAIDTEFANRLVAIKEMIQHGLSEQEVAELTESFKREALMLATLTHPGLPSIYDYFTENGRYYLVMSFIEGITLGDYLASKGGTLPIEKVLQIGIQLATVLSFLHMRKPAIIFRDLKPSNVMRTPDGQIYLIDFGIARHFKQGKVKDTLILGSPGYASPEQYGRSQTSPQSDIYSLGVLLHHLLTGVDPSLAPFAQQPLDLSGYPQFATLIMCMVELDVKKRPLSMGNIKREMQRIMTGHGRNHECRIHVQHHVNPCSLHLYPPFMSSSASVMSLSLRYLSSALPYTQKWEGFLRHVMRLMMYESHLPQHQPKQKY